MIMFEKFAQHQPLSRQTERYALEGVPIAVSTMADAVGSVCASLDPLLCLVEAHCHGGPAPSCRCPKTCNGSCQSVSTRMRATAHFAAHTKPT
jgi:transposase IS66 family protein